MVSLAIPFQVTVRRLRASCDFQAVEKSDRNVRQVRQVRQESSTSSILKKQFFPAHSQSLKFFQSLGINPVGLRKKEVIVAASTRLLPLVLNVMPSTRLKRLPSHSPYQSKLLTQRFERSC